MRFLKHQLRLVFVVCGIVLGTCATLCLVSQTLTAGENPDAKRKGSGTFVSFKNGTLTIKSHSDLVEYKHIDGNYKTYQNNEEGPGAKLVETTGALSQTVPGTVIQVDVEQREISCGLDNRTIGTFVSYADGKLNLLAADVPPGFIQKPKGNVALSVEDSTPVLESINGGDFKFVGVAGNVLKTVKEGAIVTARSEYDPHVVEVIQIGQPKRTIERYIGQTRGTVRGTFISFKDGILKLRGKGVTHLAANEYERAIKFRISDGVPIVESIDGAEYKPATVEALRTLKEGSILTVRKVEEVLLEVQIGVARKN